MFLLILSTLHLYSRISASVHRQFIEAVQVDQMTKFPLELGQKVLWRISPRQGLAYEESAGFSILLDNEVVGSWTANCDSLLPQDRRSDFTQCEVERSASLLMSFFPVADHYGKELQLIFYRNLRAVFAQSGQILVNRTVKLTRQPTYLNMTIKLDMAPDYVRDAPRYLNLNPPTFLDGSMAKVECKTDGALPPSPISFSITCPNPPLAAVEHERRSKIQLGFPYSINYRYYNFAGPPTDEELAERLALEYAKGIIHEGRISHSPDNLSMSASIPINSKAHDCNIFCRLMGKEEQIRLTVYYQTTLAYLLPTPKDGLMYAGSSMSCHADGYPSPSISLFLKQPLRQQMTEPIVKSQHYLASTSPVPPSELLVDDSAVSSTTRIGLRPDEYTIEGPHLTLAYNATPGVELLLVCTAGNALPGASDFLGTNKTIATARFVVAALSYSRIGIVLAICMAILLFAIIIITAMVVLRRRQKYSAAAMSTRSTIEKDFTNKSTASLPKKPAEQHPVKKAHKTNSSSVVNEESPRRGFLGNNYVRKTCSSIVYTKPHFSGEKQRMNANKLNEVEYAELKFDPLGKNFVVSTPKRNSLQRTGNFSSGGGVSSASAAHLSRSSGPASNSPNSHIDNSPSHYSEIVGIMKPKSYENQLVLEQQQEATQTLLALQKNKPNAFV